MLQNVSFARIDCESQTEVQNRRKGKNKGRLQDRRKKSIFAYLGGPGGLWHQRGVLTVSGCICSHNRGVRVFPDSFSSRNNRFVYEVTVQTPHQHLGASAVSPIQSSWTADLKINIVFLNSQTPCHTDGNCDITLVNYRRVLF